ncbi:MAG TPA: hypothetical protein VII92_13120 [Anaerolineae bacterium]
MANDLVSVEAEVRAALTDTATVFTDAVIDQAILAALRELNGVTAFCVIGTIVVATGSYELSLSSLTQPCKVDKVWFPFIDVTSLPAWIDFEQLTDMLLRSNDVFLSAGYTARVYYRTPHTIEDLASATATTLTDVEVGYVVAGALSNACLSKLRELSNLVNANRNVEKSLESMQASNRAKFDAALAQYRQVSKKVVSRRMRRSGGGIGYYDPDTLGFRD